MLKVVLGTIKINGKSVISHDFHVFEHLLHYLKCDITGNCYNNGSQSEHVIGCIGH